MLITQEQIWDRLGAIEKKVDAFLDRANDFDLESLSLTKTAKLLHVGDDTVKKLIANNQLKAFKINGVTRIKKSEIKRFQDSGEAFKTFVSLNCETAEQIAKRIFNK